MNILKVANEIVNERSQEKTRQYGDFVDCMKKAAKIASLMGSKKITVREMYNCMIALKLAREAHGHKEDNLLDACAYLGSLNNFYHEDK